MERTLNMNYLIRKHRPDEPMPYYLLLLADENQALIDQYLPDSQVYMVEIDEKVVGVGVLQTNGIAGEIMNIAIAPDSQRNGLGRALLRALTEAATHQAVQWLRIATGNSGIGQLALYQQEGFDLIAIDRDYFLRNYPEPIWENRIQCKHQVIFEKHLSEITANDNKN
ncbi:GNAT family N-acetyltransferase [Spirosoma validum]|uniref:GNAT family N-acetyltransferase n=1 Tax=Spirosoma validum TaxID=2771355 RepID=A0A927GD64_9BACT|nr:GNAT family N-acetyltransferase [Spirosoma validum]MBD2753472.1 GNAT family N-acetyltransferase [Spirosoma validum]